MPYLIAFLGGALISFVNPALGEKAGYLGHVFLMLMKLLLGPLVFVSIFSAIINIKNPKKLKRLGRNTLFFYLGSSASAAIVGIFFANFFFNFFMKISKESSISANITSNSKEFIDLLKVFFPEDIVTPFIKGNMLHLIFLSITLALASNKLKNDYRDKVVSFIRISHQLIDILLNWLLKLLPFGLFGLCASFFREIHKQDFSSFLSFFAAVGSAVFVQSFVVLPLILWIFSRVSPWEFFLHVRSALAFAFVSSSSAMTLPISTRILVEKIKLPEDKVAFILPLGTTLNMDGVALYHAILLLFFCHLSGMAITWVEQLTIFIMVIFSAAGTAGVPSGGMMLISMMLSFLGLPAHLVGIYLLVDRIWDPPVTAVNVWGDLIAARVLAGPKPKKQASD